MAEKVLITGGAGFIGSHVADELLRRGREVRVLDRLLPQVHGPQAARPPYLAEDVELVAADVRDVATLRRALDGVTEVLHLAARVGVGQSMYEIAEYVAANEAGTATLLQLLSERPVRKLVVASSMSIYGEGRYRSAAGATVDDAARADRQLRRGQWEPLGRDGEPLEPVATPEDKRPDLASIYALGKFAQERMCLLVGRAYGIDTVALRFFNVYGPRQALSNPYTGVLAIFGARLLNKRPPLLFEDGRQRRDFVHVHDVARACCDALAASAQSGVYNIGSGDSASVLEVACRLRQLMGREAPPPVLAGRYRVGDVRHCFADVAKAAEGLGYRPQIDLQSGLAELAEWLADEVAVDRVDEATAELAKRGLVA